MNTYGTSKSVLQQIYSIASALKVESISIRADESGWKMKMVDPAHVSAVRMVIPKDRFASYELNDALATEDGRMEDAFAIPADKMRTVLSILEDEVRMEVGDQITFVSGNITRRVGRVLVDSTPKFPNIQASTNISLDTTSVIKAMGTVGFTDAIRFKTDGNGTRVWADGDTEDISVSFADAKSESPAEASYPMDYVMSALKALPKSVVIGYQNDYPMTFSVEDPFEITMLVAPRIEQEGPE